MLGWVSPGIFLPDRGVTKEANANWQEIYHFRAYAVHVRNRRHTALGTNCLFSPFSPSVVHIFPCILFRLYVFCLPLTQVSSFSLRALPFPGRLTARTTSKIIKAHISRERQLARTTAQAAMQISRGYHRHSRATESAPGRSFALSVTFLIIRMRSRLRVFYYSMHKLRSRYNFRILKFYAEISRLKYRTIVRSCYKVDFRLCNTVLLQARLNILSLALS